MLVCLKTNISLFNTANVHRVGCASRLPVRWCCLVLKMATDWTHSIHCDIRYFLKINPNKFNINIWVISFRKLDNKPACKAMLENPAAPSAAPDSCSL